MKFFLKKLIPQGLKNLLYHWPLAITAAVYFGFPAKRIKVIGVTGTNGKTTTVQLVTRIFKQAGRRVAMASTINFMLGDSEWVNDSKFTTLSAWKVQGFLRKAIEEGCEYAVLEISSHALDQRRVWGIEYEIAVMTNVTREHLDYHHNMERYRRAKRLLFEHARNAVVNLDMDRPEEYLSAGRYVKCISYSTEHSWADIFPDQLVCDASGSSFAFHGTAFHMQLLGRFNVENTLAAIGVAELSGISRVAVAEAFKKITGIPGRMESVPNTRGVQIIIDYAVTPDALEKLYALITSMRVAGMRIIAILGACGERDRGKRPLMGKIVSAAADMVVLTNEDPYQENPERIIDEIESGLVGKEKGKEYWRISDRRAAIAQALALAHPGDWIVVTGKGAEETMAVGEKRIPWNERVVIEEELGKIM